MDIPKKVNTFSYPTIFSHSGLFSCGVPTMRTLFTTDAVEYLLYSKNSSLTQTQGYKLNYFDLLIWVYFYNKCVPAPASNLIYPERIPVKCTRILKDIGYIKAGKNMETVKNSISKLLETHIAIKAPGISYHGNRSSNINFGMFMLSADGNGKIFIDARAMPYLQRLQTFKIDFDILKALPKNLTMWYYLFVASHLFNSKTEKMTWTIQNLKNWSNNNIYSRTEHYYRDIIKANDILKQLNIITSYEISNLNSNRLNHRILKINLNSKNENDTEA